MLWFKLMHKVINFFFIINYNYFSALLFLIVFLNFINFIIAFYDLVKNFQNKYFLSSVYQILIPNYFY